MKAPVIYYTVRCSKISDRGHPWDNIKHVVVKSFRFRGSFSALMPLFGERD